MLGWAGVVCVWVIYFGLYTNGIAIIRLVRRAGTVVGTELELVTVTKRRTLEKLLFILYNAHHPLHCMFTRQRSMFGDRLLSQSCSTD